MGHGSHLYNSLRNGLPALEDVEEERAAYNPTELRMIGLLERCRTVLGNMAQEREGFWNSLFGRRWPINHEPLRHDARNLLPLIDAEIEGGN